MMAGPSTSRGDSKRSGHRASVAGGNVGLRRRRSSAASGASAKKDASRLLKSTLAEEERKQLAAWLDKKHKELDTQLKKLGVPSAPRAEALLSSGGRRQHDAGGGSGVEDDIMMILGRRLQQGPRPVHSHHMEFVLEDEDGYEGFDDGTHSVARSSPPPSYRHGSPTRDDVSYSSLSPDGRRRGSGAEASLPLPSRLARAAAMHQYSARQVLELFFPLWDNGDLLREEDRALLPLEQVVDVLGVDLGLRLSKAEARELEREADRDLHGARVDVRKLLEQAGLWPDAEQEGQQHESQRVHWAMRGGSSSSKRHQHGPGPRPDPDRARRRLKERQQAAAVQIQRVVRGRLARREVSTLRFNKVTARHQAVAQRQQAAPHSRHGQQAGSSSGKPHTQPTKDEQPRLSAFKFEEEEEEGLRAGRAKAGQRKEASEGRGRGAKVEKQEEEEDGDFDALMERLLSGQKDARAGKAAALSSGAVPGGSSPVLELLPFPLAPSPPPRAAGAGEALLLHDRPGDEPPLFTSSSSSALPYGEALVKSVTRGGEEAFYRLSDILRSSDDNSNSTPFLPYTRVRMALKEAGYGLSDEEARAFLLGMASDKQGRVDAEEVLQAVADLLQDLSFASSSHRHRRTAAGATGFSSPRPGSYMRASGMMGLSPTRASRRGGPRLSAAEREVLSQLMEGGSSEGGEHGRGSSSRRRRRRRPLSSKRLLAPFLERDPFQDGYLSLLDFASALDALGLELETEELAELAFKYRCPEELMAADQDEEEEGEGGGGSTTTRLGVDYAPFVRVIVEASGGGRRRRRGRRGHSHGSSSGSEEEESGSSDEADRSGGSDRSERSDEEEEEEEESWHHRSGRGGSSRRGGGRERLRDFLSEREDESKHADVIKSMKELFYGQDDKRKWLRMLRLTFAKVDPSGRGSVDRKTLAKVLKGGKLPVSEKDLAELSAFLATGDDGQLGYPRLLRVWDAVLDCPKEQAHELMARLLDGVSRRSTPSTRLRWVRRLRRVLTDVDKYRTGVLEPDQVVRLIHKAADADEAAGGGSSLSLSTSQLKALVQAFTTDDMEGVAYRPLLRTLTQHAGRWYELDPDAACRLLVQFPKMSPPTRFICQLRRTLRGLDSGAEGRLDVDDVDYALRKKARLRLDDRESAALLECLSQDGSGKVYYEDLLAFFHLYQLPWHELVDDVALDLSRKLFKGGADRSGWKRFSLLRSRLYDRDRSKQGVTSSKALREVLESVNVSLRPDDFMRLVEALEVDKAQQHDHQQHAEEAGSAGGGVRYRELLRHLLDLNGEAREEVTEAFIRLVRKQLAEQPQAGIKQGVAAISAGCSEDDADKTGRLSIESFRRQLQRAGVRVELEDVGHLADFCDFYGDGRLAYPSILQQVLAGHALPSTAVGQGAGQGSSSGRSKRRGAAKDWSWTRSSAVTALRSELLKLEQAGREKAVRAAFREFDAQDEGVVSVEDLEDVFDRLLLLAAAGTRSTPAASLSQGEVRDLASELFAQSQGHAGPGGGRKCIMYDELVTALTLAEKEFKARYPQPLIRRPGGTQQLLYERVLERRKNVVVGHHTPKEEAERAAKEAGGSVADAFLAACHKVDRRKTGFVSAQEAKKLAAQVGLKPQAPLDLRTLLDRHTVSGNRVQYQRVLDDFLGKRTTGRRGSGSSATAASSSSSSQHQVLASSSSSSQQQHKPVTAPLPPRVARLVKTLTDLREDDVHLGTLARTLTKCGFSGTVEEVSGLTKDLLAVGSRSIKKAALLSHVREHGAARLMPAASKGKADPDHDDVAAGSGHGPGTGSKRAPAF